MDIVYELVYVNCDFIESKVQTSGISFHEFVTAIDKKPRNILIMTYLSWSCNYDRGTTCAYYLGKDRFKMAEDERFEIEADFNWIEFDNVESLQTLSPEEIAEIYYISRQSKPINKFYFDKLKNNYFYLSHDDAHSCTVWYKDMNDFLSMFGKAICSKINLMYDLVLDPFDKVIAKQLCMLDSGGIYLNLGKLNVAKNNNILISIYCMGEKEFRGSMYSIVKNEKSEPVYQLRYNNNWTIEKI